jgi:regulator of protease activity HflC (stomatin/prohibitin superfamily)
MKETTVKPISGYLMLLVFSALVLGLGYGLKAKMSIMIIICGLLALIFLFGFFIVDPNGSKVLTLFGKYVGSVKENGFFWANPFFNKKKISLRARNFESEKIKVNDKRGNPILISVITVWKVKDTYKASFDVDNYETFVKLQSDAAVRNLAGKYSYDNFDDPNEITLRSGLEEINHALEEAISERLEMAGIEVLEARIGTLSYAEEIAGSMLKRQQAEAVVAARQKIVEGAVGMVDMALQKLAGDGIIEMDEDKKASMVSNLMVILCSDKEVTPVVNTGTLHH